jgi:hypothetical protein
MTKKKVIWLKKRDLLKFAKRNIKDVETVLDIGCGIIPQPIVKTKVNICVEPYKEYVDYLLKIPTPPFSKKLIVINCGWKEATQIFPNKSVDTVVLMDVIEHISKSVGKKLLKKTEKIARKQIIVWTPLGFVHNFHKNGKDAWGLHGVEWQEHRSGWYPEDFAKGWCIYACKNFHLRDNLGRKLVRPFGAFYAIKTFRFKDNRGGINAWFVDTFLKKMKIILNILNSYKQKITGEND